MIAASASENRPEIRITISIGVSTLQLGENDGEKMLLRADEALYAAKHQGRNRVVVAGDDNLALEE